ncbi:MAG: metal-sulfur cluster assembly factor [Propionibacteriaceae bacterium]|jgi:metal-sulfur cluster biosynthetic enzyme|uniref:Metal-sulfur cluster assembly factor n=1 Tax=Brooklawnia propionicigenes TaxID=3041175 RepID=A0AAN0K5Z2_9ACTN|nr:metal-sulfur cluster assembly factor [Brooklawnia sp. SH051]MCB0913873.1 metal-sulfur cluster assembly factor [Propionibacteriaceae bacterium]MEA5120111.1 metal-sulfur cluster assembly factor [Propionibacterium sp.]NLI83944.1 metal-sulfur cluster assembly factor [Propionibacterium sp.]BEH01180.1 metal-sulfur cluster assembly factor [Brooklawnia sp. SH051]
MTNPSDLVRDELPGDPVPATWATATAEQKKLVILEALKEVVDPELMVNVVDLGLIYDVLIDDDLNVTLEMTLTSPACPLTDQIEWEAQAVLGQLARSVTINWVWMPPWSIDLITDDGREQLQALGFMI